MLALGNNGGQTTVFLNHPLLGETVVCPLFPAQGEADPVVTPHPLYTALGADASARLTAYRELFRYDLEPGVVDEIRRATNGNFALGSERFAAQVSSVLGRRATPGKSGRPRQRPELASGGLFDDPDL